MVRAREFFGNGLATAIITIALLLGWMGETHAAKKRFVSIGTGGPTGVYFAAGNAICRLVHKEAAEGRAKGRKHGLRCSAPSTNGSTYNISEIAAGELEFGVAQSDWQYHAYNCSNDKVKCFKELRSVFSIHGEPFHLIAGKDSGIRSWGDLKGKRVNIGNPGSGHRGTMEVLMAATGTTAADFAKAAELTSDQQSEALCQGDIDAFVYTVGVPNAGVTVATDGCEARILDLNGPAEQELVRSKPFYVFTRIPKGTYRTTVVPVTTFGVVATLVTGAQVPEEDVYEVVRAVMEHISELRQLHPAFAQLNPKKMISDGLSAPLHPGPAKYYREKGWLK